MPLQVEEGGVARLTVPRLVEREPVPLAAADVAFRHQLRAGPREREVDVEEDGLQRSHSMTSSCCGDAPTLHAVVWTNVQARTCSRSSWSSSERRSSRWKTSRLEWPSSGERTIAT